jgi:hypothetical protein
LDQRLGADVYMKEVTEDMETVNLEMEVALCKLRKVDVYRRMALWNDFGDSSEDLR